MGSPTIVLASSSRYRRELLQRLQLPFKVESPAIDETALQDEAPAATAVRLAEAKAAAVAGRHPSALVIGSDQVAELDGHAIGKPGNHDAALAQLQRMQGQTVVFHTALTVISGNTRQVDCVPTSVTFRQLSTPQLNAYLLADRPYDCAGAAKIESLGVTLVERVTSDDPTALIGLPLIRLIAMLRNCGIDALAR